MERFIGVLIATMLILGCHQMSNPHFQKEANTPDVLHRSMKKLTDVIVHDIFSPPVASRIYAYPSIAAYEVIQQSDTSYQSLADQLTGFKDLPKIDPNLEYCLPLASVHAFLVVGTAMIFSKEKMEVYNQEVLKEFKNLQIPTPVYDRSIKYGVEIADHILAWAETDQYKETRTYSKHTIFDKADQWQPTPPSYMDGIEPHWRLIRPFVLDSAQQFAPFPPTKFDLNKESLFYQELMEVYQALEADDKEEREAIARFWDCNPYVAHTQGHFMFATKKITPGGHWIGITELAARNTNAKFIQSAEAYALVSITLFDAFISCWDEKYRSNLIRPETVINEYIDEDWRPILQTPPFPEYTSGHSVISRAAAIVLSDLFNNNFKFDDTVEEEYGLPVRTFSSFLQASEEAAISRLYGGIHYRPAIIEGMKQGEKVGEFILEKIKTN